MSARSVYSIAPLTLSPDDSKPAFKAVVNTRTRGKPLAECLTSIETNVFLVTYKCVIA